MSYQEKLISILGNAIYDWNLTLESGKYLLLLKRVDNDGRTHEWEFNALTGEARYRIAKFENRAKDYVVKAHEGEWTDYE